MISKSATNVNNCSLGLMFTKNARTAWHKIINSVVKDNKRKTRLLLPSYIGVNEKEGSGVFDAVEKSSADYCFYKLGSNLSVDIDDFERQIQSSNIDIALIIHYFGFCRSNMERIQQVCHNNDVLLVEDCAHAFHLGIKNQIIGNYGDFSFYSIHKYLATTSGGILKKNNTSLKISSLTTEEKIEHSVLEVFANSDFEKIANIRRMNYSKYHDLLSSDDNIEIMFDLTQIDIPQTFPLRIKNGLREKLYFYLLENEMPTVALYYRMINQIDLDYFYLSRDISSEILNLPVHQDTTIDDIEALSSKINGFFKN